MERAELAGLNNHLCRLEKNLTRIQAFQRKGCAVDCSLNDIYFDLTDIGGCLKKAQAEKNCKIAEELSELAERHKNLLAKFDSIANEGQLQNKGIVVASKSTLPDFFYRITSRNRGMWKFYEAITTLFGVGIIGLTLISLTYFFAFGDISFFRLYEGGSPVIKSLGFLVGLILGLCVHEFAHGVVLANNGIGIKQVGAVAGSIVGGFIEADETTFFQAERRVHLSFNASSIGTNALAAVVLSLIGLLTSSELLLFLALGNLFFGVINSFPVRPLDGGWVYEDLINMYLTNKKIKGIFLNARFVILILWLILFTRSSLA